jgi:hypothetical protein
MSEKRWFDLSMAYSSHLFLIFHKTEKTKGNDTYAYLQLFQEDEYGLKISLRLYLIPKS